MHGVLGLLAQRMPQVIVMVRTNHSSACFRGACLTGGAHYFFDKTIEFDLAQSMVERIVREHCTRVLLQSGVHHV
jgi:hypothetical protein